MATVRDSRANEVSEITQNLKVIAKELEILVIALNQLSRQVESHEDKRPLLSDLRESGLIEQDADVVMFVFRVEYYKERERPGGHDGEAMAKWQEEMEKVHNRAEVFIGKQRHGPIKRWSWNSTGASRGSRSLPGLGRTRSGSCVVAWSLRPPRSQAS